MTLLVGVLKQYRQNNPFRTRRSSTSFFFYAHWCSGMCKSFSSKHSKRGCGGNLPPYIRVPYCYLPYRTAPYRTGTDLYSVTVPYVYSVTVRYFDATIRICNILITYYVFRSHYSASHGLGRASTSVRGLNGGTLRIIVF